MASCFRLEVDSKGRPIDAAWAQQRVNNEPLTEIHQLKGTSETHPMLSPNDEFADYELLSYPLGGVERTPKSTAAISARPGRTAWPCRTAAGTTRTRWGWWARATRTIPPPATRQNNYFGGHGLLDATPRAA